MGAKRAGSQVRLRRDLRADALAIPEKRSGSEPPDSPESPGIMAQYRTMSRKPLEAAAEKQAQASEAEARLQAEREAHARVEEQLQGEKEARAQAEERAQAEALLKDELAAQVRAEAEAREVAEARLQAEADARERAVAEAHKEAETKLSQMEQQARHEAQARLKAEEEARVRAEAEALAQAEAREEAEAAAKEEAEARVKAEAEMAEKLTRAEARYEALASENEICSTALAGAEARADHSAQETKKAEANRVKEAKAKEEAEAQARQEAESRARAEARAAEEAGARAEAEARAEREAAARGLAEKKVAAEAAARSQAEEKVAVEAAARSLAEEKVAAEAEARTRALNRQLELEARALATQSALLEAESRASAQAKAAEEAESRASAQAKAAEEAESRANAQAKAAEEAESRASAQAKAAEEAEARASAQAKAAEEAEARANAQAKAAEEAEARANAHAKATQEAQMYATAECQAAAAARAEVERLTQERARVAPAGGALDARREDNQGMATPAAAASPDRKLPPLEGKLKNVRRGLSTSNVVALSPGPHVHTLKNHAGAAGVCRRALPQVDVMPEAEQKEEGTHTHSHTSPHESEGGVSIFEKSPRRSPLDGSPRLAQVADAASSPVNFGTGVLVSTPSAYTVDRSMVSSPSLSRGALIPETPTADLQPGSPSSYASRPLPTDDAPLQNWEVSGMVSPSTVCTTQVFEADEISNSEPGMTLTLGLASQHNDSTDHLPKPRLTDALRGTDNAANGAEKPRTHDNDRLFRIIVEMNRKMNLMSEELSEVRARNDARDGAHTMEVDALVAQLLPLSSQVESLSRKCESMEARLAQTEAQSRQIFETKEANYTENTATAQKKKKAAAPGRLTPRIEALEKSVTALQNQADTLSSQHVKSTGRTGQWQRQAARGIGALESRVAGAARAVEDTQALAFALAERLASVEAKNEERNASHAPLKEDMREAGGGADSSGSIDAEAKTSDSIFIFSAEKESQVGEAEGLTTPPQKDPQKANGQETQAAPDLGSAAQGRSETEKTAPSPEAEQTAPKEPSVEDFLPALVHCQGLSHQLRQLESAVEASAVAQRRLEEHVEAAAVEADAADAGSGSGNAPEGESAAELEALGYESRVGRGAVLQATQAARRECVRMTSTIETEVLKRLDGSTPPAQSRKGGAVEPGEGRAKKDFFSCHASAERALDQEAVLRNLQRNSPEARRWNSSTSTNARHKSKRGWKKQAFKAVGISM